MLDDRFSGPAVGLRSACTTARCWRRGGTWILFLHWRLVMCGLGILTHHGSEGRILLPLT